MPADPPPVPVPPAGREDAVPVRAAIETRLDMVLPAACIAGVGDNMALLAHHWADLRRCLASASGE